MRAAPVAAPAPQRPLINLLGAANTPADTGRWQDGTAYVPESFATVSVRDTCSAEAVVVRDTATGDMQSARSVYAEVLLDCSNLGGHLEEFETRALAAIDAELPRAVEAELWTGALTEAAGVGNHYLTEAAFADDVTPTPGTPVKPTAAVGLLEQALAEVYSGPGIIHVSRYGQPFVPNVTRSGRVLETRVGNRVVPGVGYPNTGPGGDEAPAGSAWLYITPMVTVRIGAPETVGGTTERVDVSVNRVQGRARVPFEVTIEGDIAFAVLMQTQVE